jgi:hypothetical protein
LGDELNGAELGYFKAASAVQQASRWNEILADDPVFGPSSGCKVGVGVRVGRYWPLVWVRADHAPEDEP